MLRAPFALFLVAGVCSAVALVAGNALHAMWPDWRWQHEPLHSMIEAVGGLGAIAMAMVLLHTHDKSIAGRHRALAAGFLGMGILEEFHAAARPGNGFVLFRNMASLAGSIGLLLVWRRHASADQVERRSLPWVIAIGAMAVGIWCLVFPQYLPEMMRNGELTPTAVAPQSIACVLFLLAAARFLWGFRRSKRSEDALFANLALLYGLAEFEFMHSIPWGDRWWFWHALRLIACLLALAYIGRSYIQVTHDWQVSLVENIHAKETLSQSEGQIRRILNERERMAQDLHDSTIQSLFAINLNLERCQRLVSTTQHDVGTQLGRVVVGLTAVIRDLRRYILGLEAPISSGSTFETTLTSLVNDLNHSSQLQFRLHVNPEAAGRLTPEQASQLLPIAREAMTNSLRHADAQTISLTLHLYEGRVRLIVEDDGVGFDASTALRHGHGLKNMENRARALGGRLEVMSDSGHGTRIICDLAPGA